MALTKSDACSRRPAASSACANPTRAIVWSGLIAKAPSKCSRIFAVSPCASYAMASRKCGSEALGRRRCRRWKASTAPGASPAASRAWPTAISVRGSDGSARKASSAVSRADPMSPRWACNRLSTRRGSAACGLRSRASSSSSMLCASRPSAAVSLANATRARTLSGSRSSRPW